MGLHIFVYKHADSSMRHNFISLKAGQIIAIC